jgi:hypothetical protein
MSRGIPSLNTSPKSEPGGAPFNPNDAENGLSVDPVSGKIVLGNDVGAVGDPAQLLSDREIQRNGCRLRFPDSSSNSLFEMFGTSFNGSGNTDCYITVNNSITGHTVSLFTDGLSGIHGVDASSGVLQWFNSGGCALQPSLSMVDPGQTTCL